MKTPEFESELGTDANLRVPENLAAQIPKHEAIIPENDDDETWRRLTQEQFLRGYGESDSIYDAV